MSIQILTATGRDAARWQSFIDRLPYAERDVHFTPFFARVQEASGRGTALAAVMELGDSFILQPFLKRSGPHDDLTSFFGGGGAVMHQPHPTLVMDFDDGLTEWAKSNSILCAYTQCNPAAAPSGVKLKDQVIVDLRPVDISAQFSRNRRRGILADQERGLTIRQLTMGFNELHTFDAFYFKSMERLGAGLDWYYPPTYWQHYRDELAPEYCSLLAAELGNRIEAMLLMAHGYGKAYAHYLAGPSSDMLYHESMKLAKDLGCSGYVVGGGTTSADDDPLLAYKLGFSKMRSPVYVNRRIFDRQAYDKACVGLTPTDYFPAYRSPDANRAAAQ